MNFCDARVKPWIKEKCLPRLDKYILGRLSSVLQEVEEAYEQFQFNRASQALQRFAVADLSNFYLDVAKDRLYIAAPDDFRRHSCQTVMQVVLDALAKAMAPLLPHMAEDIWQNIPYPRPSTSVFEAGWVDAQIAAYPPFEAEAWAGLLRVRDDVNKALEAARRAGAVGASQEAAVYISAPEEGGLRALLEGLMGDSTLQDPPSAGNNVDDLRFLLLTSQVHLVASQADVESACGAELTLAKDTESGAVVGVRRASGHKCARCWYFCDTVNSDPELPHICPRCANVVREVKPDAAAAAKAIA